MMNWEWKKQDRVAVLQRLKEGDYDAITTSKGNALDELVHLSIEMGVFEALQVIEVERQREGIPDQLLLRTLFVLPFIEAMGLSAAADMLFEDAAVLLQLGYTMVNLQQGFNERRRRPDSREKSDKAKPCHPEVLRAELERITPDSLQAFQQECVQALHRRGLLQGQTYAIDGSGLGTQYQLVGLLNVHKGRPMWMAWRVLAGEASEKGAEAHVVKDMVDQVLEITGAGGIEWLLLDALYADGPLLAWLKYARGIKVLVRLPEDRRAYEDLMLLVGQGLADTETHMDVSYLSGQKHQRRISTSVAESGDWESFRQAATAWGDPEARLWVCAIRVVDMIKPDEEKTWALVSTHFFSSGWQGYGLWRKRWRIENSGFRELKEGWHLEKAPWSYRHPVITLARVTLTLVAFNVAQVAKTARGRQLTDRGIRRLRRELTSRYGPAPVIVFAGDAYGVFHIEEIATALGVPPAFRLQRKADTLS